MCCITLIINYYSFTINSFSRNWVKQGGKYLGDSNDKQDLILDNAETWGPFHEFDHHPNDDRKHENVLMGVT